MNMREVLVLAFLLGVGTLRMAADLLHLPRLDARGAALQVSPAMKVFTAHRGFETYASRFALHWDDAGGAARRLVLDPVSYQRLRGPYNRRNVYGAALAYGPLLRSDTRTLAMQESVMQHAFCSPRGLRDEFGIPKGTEHVRIEVTPLRADARRDLPLHWEVRCGH